MRGNNCQGSCFCTTDRNASAGIRSCSAAATAGSTAGAANARSAGISEYILEYEAGIGALGLVVDFNTFEVTERYRIDVDLESILFHHTVVFIGLVDECHPIAHAAAATTRDKDTHTVDALFVLGQGQQLFR
jgi:hypothetical protein